MMPAELRGRHGTHHDRPTVDHERFPKQGRETGVKIAPAPPVSSSPSLRVASDRPAGRRGKAGPGGSARICDEACVGV